MLSVPRLSTPAARALLLLATGLALAACGAKDASSSAPTGPAAQGAPGRPPGPGGGPGGGGPGGRGGPPTLVEASPVELREFVTRIEALGTLEPRERVELTANASDRVTGLYFEDGQRVRRGATLMTLATEEERAQLEAAQATLAEARRQLDRNQRLADDGAVSQLELQRSTRDSEAADAQVRAVEARLRDRVLIAPFDGVLGFRRVSLGAYVSPGQPVATLIDDSEMRLEFTIPSVYAAALQPGLAIVGRSGDLPGAEFGGRLTSIDNAIDPVTRTVRVRATLPNDRRELKAGMFMTVELMSANRRSLGVPEIAVIAEGSESFVFVAARDEGGAARVEKMKIAIGARERGVVEVISGLEPGQLVVTEGVLKLRPGAPVRLQAGEKPPGGGKAAGAGAGDQPVLATSGRVPEAPGLVR